MILRVDKREFATILAALRYWQRRGLCTDGRQGNLIVPAPEEDVATDSGTHKPLVPEEIDALCERLNCE